MKNLCDINEEIVPDKKTPVKEGCSFCGASFFESRNSNYKGCRYCRNGRFGKPIGYEPPPSYEAYLAQHQGWVEYKEKNFPGGFTAFCQRFGLDEEHYRKPPTREEYENL